MAATRAVVLALLVVTLLAAAQVSEAAAKKTKCGKNPFAPLYSCVPSVMGDKPKPPSTACCEAIRKANLDCLCEAVSSTKPPSLPANIKINLNALRALPKVCKRAIPKNYKCKGRKF